MHLLTGYEGNSTFIVPKVPTILVFFLFCMNIDICPLLYTSWNVNQWDEWLRKVREIWLTKLPQGVIVIVYLLSAVSVI